MLIEPFGFTRTQSRVYGTLVGLGPSTGYAVARSVGIARANAYDALNVLVARGLASCTGGRPVRFTAASPDAVIETVSKSFRVNLTKLSSDLGVAVLDSESARPVHQSLFELRGEGQVLGAFRTAVEGARSEVLAVVGPWLHEVFSSLTVCRGLRIACRVVSLGRPSPEGAVVRVVEESELRAYWGGLPLAVVVDRARAVCAVECGGEWAGIDAVHAGLVPFLRHLLRRELASGAGARA